MHATNSPNNNNNNACNKFTSSSYTNLITTEGLHNC